MPLCNLIGDGLVYWFIDDKNEQLPDRFFKDAACSDEQATRRKPKAIIALIF